MSRSDRSFYRVSRRWIADLMERLALSQRSRFNVLAILIGVLSGLSAVAFHQSIHWAEENWIYRVSQIPGWMGVAALILLPALGGLVVGFLIKHWAPEAAGSGIPQVKAAYFLKFGRIRFRAAVGKFLLGTASIGTGASLGREGPTVHLSAAIASWVGRWFGLAPRQIMALIPLGCAGGIAAAFNTPLAAIVFAIEEIMGDMKHKAFAGIVMVAVIAAVIERSLLGTDAMFQVPLHPDHLSGMSLVMSLVLGVLAGFVSHAFVECLLRARERVKLVRGRYSWMMPGLGGLLTGCVGALVYSNLGHMGVFGIGYLDLSSALAGSLGLGVLLALFLGKFAATIFSYSSGGSGGIFAPTLFIGAMLGGAIGVISETFTTETGLLPHVLALVGMGALFAGVIRAPVTSILIIFELTRDYNLILPIMLANLTSYAIATKLRHVPIYEALLIQDGINLRKFPILRPSQGWQNMPVGSIMTNTVHTLRADMSLADAWKKIKGEGFKVYPVVDDEMHYVGLVHRKGVKIVSAQSPKKQVRDIFISDTFPKVYPDTRIREAAKQFVNTEWIALPVVSRLDEGRVVGVVTLHDITRQQFLQETKGD
ncbi:chloride channel protein [Pelagicoccus sp. NFK12]|uniref:Chloride channel protein n=1 Tax=Pelagicoccus enzymogenes TaxID=2773457 RepID=A0A927F4Y7_9BACT|nr:chloride channel protein [Pelagicoccus enzymogenes]MBD5778479.1 chloride channel protein [Pelagicoccus enzymogenes]